MAFPSSYTKIFFLSAVFLAGAFVFWYGRQAHWAMSRPSGIEPIPVRALVHDPPSDEYVECKVGSLKMKVPPSLCQSPKIEGGRAVVFEGAGRKIGVFLARKSPSDQQAAWTQFISDAPERYRCSRQRARAASSAVGSRDIDSGLSREERLWHDWLTEHAPLLRPAMADSVETLFRDNFEGLLLWMTNGRTAILEWETPDLGAFGTIVFSEEGKIEKDWVRAVLTSLDFDGTTYSLPMKDADIRALVEVEQPVEPLQKESSTQSRSESEVEEHREGEPTSSQ